MLSMINAIVDDKKLEFDRGHLDEKIIISIDAGTVK